MTLEAAGLTDDEETGYRALVALTSGSAADVAAHSGRGATEMREALASLERKGLVGPVRDSPGRFSPAAPDVALLPRLRQRAEAIDQARAELAELTEVYRGNVRRRDAGRLIEVITGAEALRLRLREIQDQARHEMVWFCKAQYVAMPSGSNGAEYDALARGVRYRVVYERGFFDEPGAVDNVAEGVHAGEIARTVPELPLRLAIADGSVAVCPLVPGGPAGGGEEPTAALVRSSSLLDALVALFERYWDDAVPLHVAAPGAQGATTTAEPGDVLSAPDRQLLSLLVAGVADKAIASHMGLSRRTLQRRIQQLMELAGADTRMQLAWRAARRDWI